MILIWIKISSSQYYHQIISILIKRSFLDKIRIPIFRLFGKSDSNFKMCLQERCSIFSLTDRATPGSNDLVLDENKSSKEDDDMKFIWFWRVLENTSTNTCLLLWEYSEAVSVRSLDSLSCLSQMYEWNAKNTKEENIRPHKKYKNTEVQKCYK